MPEGINPTPEEMRDQHSEDAQEVARESSNLEHFKDQKPRSFEEAQLKTRLLNDTEARLEQAQDKMDANLYRQQQHVAENLDTLTAEAKAMEQQQSPEGKQ